MKTPSKSQAPRSLILAAALVSALVSSASAQDYTWTGAVSGNMSVADNWSPGLPPSGIDSHMIFTGAGATSLFLGAPRNVGQVTFTTALSSNMSIRFANTETTGLRNWNLAGNATQNATITVQAGSAGSIDLGVSDAPGSLVISGGSELLVNQAGGGELVFSRPITVSTTTTAGVTLTGGGNVTFTAANSFNGTLSVVNGRLSIGTINNASINGRLGNSTNAVVLGGSGTTGTLRYTGSAASSDKDFLLATGGNATFEVTPNNLTLSGNISGSGGLTKAGNGTLTLNGTLDYSGLTTVTEGTLTLSSIPSNTTSLAINGTPAVTIASLNPGTAINFSTPVTGNGRLQATGAGSVITITGNNTIFTGQIWVNTGATMVMADNNAFGSAPVTLVNNGPSLELANGTTLNNNLSFAAAGANKILIVAAGNSASINGTVSQNSANPAFINVGANGTLTLNGAIGGIGNASITKTGAGTLNLTAANTYNGPTEVDGGLLNLTSNSTILGSTVVNVNNGGTLRIGSIGNRLQTTTDLTINAGGTLDLRKNQTIATLNGAGNIVGSVAAYSLTVDSGNFTGNFTGTNGITKTGNGTLSLSGVNTYTGNTTVSDGTLALSGGSALSNSGRLFIVSPGVVDVTGSETVNELYINGTQQAAGNYTNSNPAFTGSGTLIVLSGPVGGYSTWASTYVEGQAANLDFDGDGIDNGAEFFMGTAGNAFTPNPQPVAGVITWPVAGVSGASGIVEVSSNLSVWTNAAVTYPGSVDTSNPAQIQFTLPTGAGKIFARLTVTIP